MSFTANPNNGFYTIVINNPGTYELMIEAEGYKIYTEHIDFTSSEYTEPMTFKFVNLIPE